jgi:hypothetical protein
VDSLLAGGLPGRTAHTPADPRRRLLSPAEAIARLRSASGHGAGTQPLLDYAFDIGPNLRAIVLDATHRDQGSDGTLSPAQLTWLDRQLARAGRRYVVVISHQPLDTFAQGRQALAIMDRYPRVVAAIAGHTHKNRIVPRRTADGGYWLITTSSLADYPQQARAFRLVHTANGHVALETWMIDHDDADMAGVSRELSYLDVQGGRPNDFDGSRLDRNVRLFR